MRVLAVDPGTANTGLVVLEDGVPKPRLLYAEHLVTKPGAGSKSENDVRRLAAICRGFVALVNEHRPDLVVVEDYVLRGGRRGGWKVIRVVGALVALATHLGVAVRLQGAGDRAAASKDKASVVSAMCRRVTGLRAALESWPIAAREHIADAAAHAVAVLDVDRRETQ